MTIVMKGIGASDVVPLNSTLRLAFGKAHFFANDETFAPKFNELYNALPYQADLFTITRSGVLPGATSAAVNVRENDGTRTAGELVAAVQAMSAYGFYIELLSVELLTGADRANANNATGAAALQAAADAATAARNDPLQQFLNGLGEVGHVLMWVSIAVVVIALLFMAGKMKNELHSLSAT